jgi:predicted nucleic acid-binding Zn ribbon protein
MNKQLGDKMKCKHCGKQTKKGLHFCCNKCANIVKANDKSGYYKKNLI